ncbi:MULTISPECIES: plasmid replication protein RepC [Bradyrhizobium]|uniref:Replication initiation protein RepC n=3 Tax=Bradyrhizobium TaxID=374 RepID=A0AAE6CCA3_9BRAD|nr:MULTISPECIES: plasmid replication protein RepC [Bradyrhizobium]MCG2633127.1 replication initiation protein RepC [Bradyrhizobium zhengyangense]MCG2645695.1 replication initiation protein RepC [Bradyrhizobium zhengyangense]MCG2673316.1 replication initiation protein RepC [Bradyrhizobium zhengyangense]MDN4985458.1 plasmid replication protein RepC [Bradyrhizobium sp. WYCCWR 13022]MDN5006223.1 plasmid replication protein RepC [Bradyrhizobium sp. WYCCWR 12677]
MQSRAPTTPFGRRSLKLAHVATQVAVSTRPSEKIVHKWKIFQAICIARPRLGISERALTVLDALLSFHPETTLTGEGDLIVFPSNNQLTLRAHGMPVSTLRRHLAVLVDAGLIVRRDSPNGKRYARKGSGGDIERAFGFDLSPLVVRAEEFERLAEEIKAEARAIKHARERITLCRRDIAKMIATGIEENVPTHREWKGPADWDEVHRAFRSIVETIPRRATCQELEAIADELSQLADDVLNLLETHVQAANMSANESHTERHLQNSNPNTLTELEPSLQEGRAASTEPQPQPARFAEGSYPLGMVLSACPDIVDYAKGGISNWRDFIATAAVVRSMLGISPSAWEEAQSVMGETQAAIVVGCILQRGEVIRSAGGYLRGLTRKAEAGEFSLGPILMAQINSRLHEKRRA